MGKVTKIIFFCLLILIIATLAINKNQKEIKVYESSVSQHEEDTSNNNNSKEYLTLPEFSTVDIFGITVDPSTLEGRKAFIQFIDPKSDSQIKTLMRIIHEYENENLTIITFIKEAEDHIFSRFMDEVRFALGKISIVAEDYEKFKEVFEAPSCCESFMLFNEGGKLVASGINQDLFKKDIRAYLNKLAQGKRFVTANYIKPGTHISDNDWLSSLSGIIEEEDGYDYFLFSMFNNICVGCPSGLLISKIKDAFKSVGKTVCFSIILSDDYTENDANNLKVNFDINFPVFEADERLMKNWNQLTKEFSKGELNNIVFTVNKKGEILDVMILSRFEEFFNNLVK